MWLGSICLYLLRALLIGPTSLNRGERRLIEWSWVVEQRNGVARRKVVVEEEERMSEHQP